jgi:hypothetical protein
MLIFLNVYYVPGMELNLLSVSQIMWHNPQLDVNFSNHKCYIVDKETKKIVALGSRRIVQTGGYWMSESMNMASITGARYFLLFVDDYSRKM